MDKNQLIQILTDLVDIALKLPPEGPYYLTFDLRQNNILIKHHQNHSSSITKEQDTFNS